MPPEWDGASCLCPPALRSQPLRLQLCPQRPGPREQTSRPARGGQRIRPLPPVVPPVLPYLEQTPLQPVAPGPPEPCAGVQAPRPLQLPSQERRSCRPQFLRLGPWRPHPGGSSDGVPCVFPSVPVAFAEPLVVSFSVWCLNRRSNGKAPPSIGLQASALGAGAERQVRAQDRQRSRPWKPH